jgi:hypothetical protein
VIISELVKDVGELIVANTNNRISMQVQRKTKGNLIQGGRLYDRDLNRNQLNLSQDFMPQVITPNSYFVMCCAW